MNKRYDLAQVAELAKVPEDLIIRFVSYCWILPAGDQDQIFDEEDLARIRLIHDLQENLGVNQEAIPIILDLVDQLNRLHRELRRRQ